MNNVYIGFLEKSFRQRYFYRANSYIYILSSMLSLFVKVSVWKSLFKEHATVSGVTLSTMIDYVIISMILGSLIDSSAGNKMANKIRDGSISADFIRPVNFKLYLMMEDLGDNLYYTIFSTLPVCIISAIFLKFHMVWNPLTLLVFMISAINGIVLIYYINYTLGLLAFWFKNSLYVNWFVGAFFTLFGGTFVPIWFYPDILYKISMILPFRLISYSPVSIYLEQMSLADSIKIIALQVLWIVVLVVIEKLMWKSAQKVVTVQGG